MNEALLYWGFGLFALAALLLVIEIFIPSGGVIGIVSALVAIAGVVSFFRYSTTWGLTSLLALLVLAPASVVLAFKVWPDTAIGRRLILGGSESGESEEAEAIARRRAQERMALEQLIGREGRALTDMYPVGEVEVDGQRHEGLAQGKFVDRGQKVRVAGIEGRSLKVRPVAEA